MASLFISYSRRDIEAARKLTKAFQGQELDFWIDWEGIPPTVDWWKEIEKGIEEADIFLFLLSPSSAGSRVCRQELEHAIKNGKRLIPVVVQEIPAGEAPAELRVLNWIYLRESDDFDRAFDKLTTAIKTDYAWVQIHRRLQMRALEWERGSKDHSFLLRGRDLVDAEAQVVTNAGKNPPPTDLQTEYLLTSRKTTDTQRTRTTTFTSIAAVVLAVLAIFAFVQARLAEQREKTARSGELVVQSLSQRDQQFDLSLLLSVEAFRTAENTRTRNMLLSNTQNDPELNQYVEGVVGRLFTIAFLEDRNMLAIGGCYGLDRSSTCTRIEILLWDVAAGKPSRHQMAGNISGVTSMAFSPDGKILASGNADYDIFLWDLETDKPLGKPLRGHIGLVKNLAFSPDGKTLASGSDDSTVILWDVRTQQPLGKPLAAHANGVSSLAFSPDGHMLASGGIDQAILLWDVKTKQPRGHALEGHEAFITSLAFSLDSKVLASGSNDGAIFLWDVEGSQTIPEPLPRNASAVNSLAFSPDGKTLASAGCSAYGLDTCARGEIRLLELGTESAVEQKYQEHFGQVIGLVFSSDGKTLASAGEDGRVIVWGTKGRQSIAGSLLGAADWVSSLAFGPDGKKLASAGGDGISIWNMESHPPRPDLLLPVKEGVSKIAFSPDGHILAFVSDRDHAIIFWDMKTGQPIGKPLQGQTDQTNVFAFRPDSKLLAWGNQDGTILLWNVETQKPIGQPLHGHSNFVTGLAFSPNGKILASSSGDNSILLWDVETYRPIGQPLIGNLGAVSDVAFSADGELLASASGLEVALWDIKTHRLLDRLPTEHSYFLSRIAFTPDGSMLASTAGFDNRIILWDVESRQPMGQPLTVNHRDVGAIAFSPNGKTLASTGCADLNQDPCKNYELILWNLDPQSWVEKTCQRVGRNLTQEEWDRYFPAQKYHKTCSQWPKHPSYYRARVERILTDFATSHQVQTPLEQLKIEMQKDSSIEDPTAEFLRTVREGIAAQISQGLAAQILGEVDLDLLEESTALQIDLEDADLLNKICWSGSLSGVASRVLPYCEQAVTLDPDSAYIHDSRGLARALTGDYAGAIQDFQFFVDHRMDQEFDENRVQQRQRWIVDLKAGRKPFTPETLEELKTQ